MFMSLKLYTAYFGCWYKEKGCIWHFYFISQGKETAWFSKQLLSHISSDEQYFLKCVNNMLFY